MLKSTVFTQLLANFNTQLETSDSIGVLVESLNTNEIEHNISDIYAQVWELFV